MSIERFLFTLAAVTVAAKFAGHFAKRIGQPPVLGELVAGVLLGASVLNVIPAGGGLHEVIALLAEVGVILLLFEIGLETDLKEMFRVGPAATIVASVGVAVPFALGFLLWYYWQPDLAPGTHGDSVTMVAIFVGATLTATSVGITSRVLTDMGQMSTPEARIVLGAAIVDDVMGLVILAIVSGLVAGATISIFGIALKFAIAVGFLVAAVVIGRWIVPRVFGYIEQMDIRGVLVAAAFSFALALAGLASLAGSAMIIGAFAAGIVLSSTNQFDFIRDRMQPVADIFAPIFFLYVGSAVDLSLLNPFAASFDSDILIVAAAVLAVAVFGKVVAGYSVGWGKQKLNQLAIGVGMIPRGEVGLIFAHLGLASGVIGSEGFNTMVLVVIDDDLHRAASAQADLQSGNSHGIASMIRIGSRGSALALWQAGHIKARLEEAHPGLSVEIEVIKTTGDKITDVALSMIGEKGLFTKELDQALLDGRVDLAVHSLKDVPTQVESGLVIAAIGAREDPSDALVVAPGRAARLADLPAGSRIGTSSLRRRAQLLALRPDLNIVDLRGNLDTRLAAVQAGEYDAVILALAGMKRLGRDAEATEILDARTWLPAVGQGALGVVAREDDLETRSRVSVLDDADTHAATTAERALLRELEGGCQIPIGALALLDQDDIHLRALVASIDGTRVVRAEGRGRRLSAEELGISVAHELLASGAREILAELRNREPDTIPNPPAP